MTTRIDINIDTSGLLEVARLQTLAGREALIVREQQVRAEKQGVEQRAAARRTQGRDVTTGERLPSRDGGQGRFGSTVQRLDEEPAANKAGGVNWGLGWVYVNFRKWERTLDEEAEGECELLGTSAPTEISVEIFSGSRGRSARLSFLSDSRLFHDLVLPVAKDKFVYIAIGENQELGRFTGAAALVSFNFVTPISLPESTINRIMDSNRSLAVQLGRVGWLTYGASMYSPNLGGDLSCDSAVGARTIARNFSNRQGFSLPFGYALGSPACYSVYGLIDQWDSGRPAYEQGMRTPPIQLSDNTLGGWVPKCVDPEKYTIFPGELSEAETAVFFPSSYGIFKAPSPSTGFAVQVANLPGWKQSYLGPSGQDPSQFINQSARESSIKLRAVSSPPNLTPFLEDLSPDTDRLITFFNEPGLGDAICVAVIDETTPGIEIQTNDWNQFRTKWPDRPFHLLVPSSRLDDVILPIGWDGTRNLVEREPGVSDWFSIIGLGALETRPVILLFIDNSGSMTTATVQGSLDLFERRCKENCFQIGETTTSASERYIVPFITSSSGSAKFYEQDPDKGKFYCLLSNPWNRNWTEQISSLGISLPGG